MPPRPVSPHPILVGVGASAGGLDALQEFLRAIAPGKGLALLVVFHQDPTGRNLLPELLSRHAQLPVAEARDGEAVAPERIYVAPVQAILTVEGGLIRLSPLETTEDRRTPIDRLLHSIAHDADGALAAVILSGEGSDGALGLKAVSDAGGVTFVQDPATAQHDRMPQSAIATGATDHVLPPHTLGIELMTFASHLRDTALGMTALSRQVEDVLPVVCDLLLHASGHNFKHYKTSTLVRRVLRRVQVLRMPSAQAYVERLRSNKTEAEQLFNDLLIGVTAFFRDPDAFATLSQEVLARLFVRRAPDLPVRIWCAGCATGEEAYTLAMLVREHLDTLPPPLPEVQIFATDIDEQALSTARQGAYPVGIAEEIGPERLKRFFVKKGQQYQVTKEIRELVLFSVHNVINDPPFSRLDLISCRNVLIYLGAHLQKKLIPLFHYALRPGGYLFLGPSENLSNHRELFRPVEARHRISQRLPTAIRSPGLLAGRSGPVTMARSLSTAPTTESDIYLLMQRIVLDEFAPKAVVVNEEGQVVSASGNLEKYLSVSAGPFNNSLVHLAREGLRVGIRAALAEATKIRRKVVNDGLNLRTATEMQRVMVTVQPMPQMGEESGLFLVVFQDVGAPIGPDKVERAAPHEDAAALVEQLERELSTTRSDLERTVQDLEAANEELKAGNEELLSMNEELQSANEELETSKEEVQAANDSLARVNTDLENLLTSTQIATLFLDREGNIRRVTPAAEAVYRVRPEDAGRPLADFTHKARGMPPLPPFLVVRDAEGPIEHTVELEDGTPLLRRVLPYHNRESTPEGVVVTFTDVSGQRQMQEALAQHARVLDAALSNIRDCVYIFDAEQRFVFANQVLLDLWGLTAEQALGKTMADLGYPAATRDTLSCNVSEVLASGRTVRSETFYPGPTGASNRYENVLAPIYDGAGHVVQVAGTGRDVTARAAAEDALRESEAHHRYAIELNPQIPWTADPMGKLTDFSSRWLKLTGLTREQATGDSWMQASHPEDRPKMVAAWARCVATGTPYDIEHRVRTADGSYHWMRSRSAARRDDTGAIVCWYGSTEDIDDHKRAEADLRYQLALTRSITDNATTAIFLMDAQGRCTFANHAAVAMTGYASDDLLGQVLHDRIHHCKPDGTPYPSAACPIERALPECAEVRDHQDVFVRQDGTLFPVVCNARVIHKEGEAIGTVIEVVDQTERRRVEQAAHEAATRVVTLLESVTDGFLAIDRDWRLTYANREAERILGRRPGDLIGKSVWAEYPALVGSEFERAFRRVAEVGGTDTATDFYPDHGRYYEMHAYASADGISVFLRDVTDQRQAEEALREEDQRKTEFLATLAHELRNPLAPLRNALTVMRVAPPEKLAEKRDRLLDMMERQVRQLVHLVDDLLDMSRIATGKIELRPERLDMREVVRAALETSSPLIEAGRHQVEERLPGAPLWVEGDRARLTQVLTNILNNAAKYTPAGGMLTVTGFERGGNVWVQVADTGVGIPASMLPRVFDVFTQVSRTLDRAQGGLGLGLALVKRVVEMHGGQVWAESPGLGQGSCFTVRLPRGG